MLTVRLAQLHALEALASDAYERRLGRHAQQFFPERVAFLTEPELHAYVRQAVAAARGHGLASERDICKYLNLALSLGPDFDTDPALPWARAILTAEHIGPTLRINRLYLKATEYMDAEGF
jgi:hypothetical protein